MVAAPKLPFTNLVLDRPDTFQVHTDAYMAPGVFDAEMRRIFELTWVYVGHESQIRLLATTGRRPSAASRSIHTTWN